MSEVSTNSCSAALITDYLSSTNQRELNKQASVDTIGVLK
jgi:hypothetical protein